MQQKWFQVIQKATTMVKEVMTLYMPQKWFQVIQKGTTTKTITEAVSV